MACFSDAILCHDDHEHQIYTMIIPVTMLCMGAIIAAVGTAVTDRFSREPKL